MSPPQDEPPPILSETEAALYAALTALIRTLPPGSQRQTLAQLLHEDRAQFLREQKPQAAALSTILASYADTGEA